MALVVDHYFPMPDRDAGSRCTLSLVTSLLALGFKVAFIPENFASFEPYRRRLEEWGVLCLWGDEMSLRWQEWLEKQIPRVDLILYNRPNITARFLAPLSRLYPEAFRLYNIHDLHGLRQQLEATHSDGLAASLPPMFNPATTLDRLCTEQELQILPKMQGIITLSEKETDLLRRHFPGLVHTVPGYIMRWRGDGASREFAAEKLLFVGGFAHHPNRLGLEWFLQRVMPHLPERVRLIVVGSNCPPELESRLMSTSGVLYEGSVNDQRLAELYASTRISLAPLPYGAGLKGKVVEALSWGHRVLGSEYAFEGLDLQPYAAPVLATRCCRTAEEYMAAVTEALAMDSDEGRQLDAACQAFIERRFSREAQQLALKALLPDALSQKQRPATVDTMPWPDAVRGGPQRGVVLLSSSYGLCSDGWLESSNRLALELTAGVTELRLGFYIPDLEDIDGKAALELELGDGQELVLRGRLAIQSGETRTTLTLPHGIKHLATLSVRSFYSYQPSDHGDVRQLVAVLSELQARSLGSA
ncbi:MAG: glycosyltransferase [Cyanobium sp.]